MSPFIRLFALLVFLELAVQPVQAQTETAPVVQALAASQFETWDEQSKTPLGAGDRHRIVYTTETDSAIVWSNLAGEPRIFRARIDGQLFARTLTGGTFPVSDSLLQAYRWMQDATFRQRLEALLEDEAVTVRNQ